MQKIMVENRGIGLVEWTPPACIQEKFDAVSKEIVAGITDFMGRMVEGYLLGN